MNEWTILVLTLVFHPHLNYFLTNNFQPVFYLRLCLDGLSSINIIHKSTWLVMDAVKPKKNRSIQFSLHYYLHHGLNFVHFLPPSGNHVLLIYLKIIIYISLRNYQSFQVKQFSFLKLFAAYQFWNTVQHFSRWIPVALLSTCHDLWS